MSEAAARLAEPVSAARLAEPVSAVPEDDTASSPAEVADGRVVLPILESQRDDVASIVDLEPSFGHFEDPMGRVNGSVSYGPLEEELAAERRRRRARAHQRHVDRSRSRDWNRATQNPRTTDFHQINKRPLC